MTADGPLFELRLLADALAATDRLLLVLGQQMDMISHCLPATVNLEPARSALLDARRHLDVAVLELHEASRTGVVMP